MAVGLVSRHLLRRVQDNEDNPKDGEQYDIYTERTKEPIRFLLRGSAGGGGGRGVEQR